LAVTDVDNQTTRTFGSLTAKHYITGHAKSTNNENFKNVP